MKTPEEIKKGLECCLPFADEDCAKCPYALDGCAKERVQDTLAYIQQLEAQVPKWISVEERLPEPETDVLTWNGRCMNNVTFGYDRIGNLIFWEYDCDGCMDELYPTVTHWMPLPEGPKEG